MSLAQHTHTHTHTHTRTHTLYIYYTYSYFHTRQSPYCTQYICILHVIRTYTVIVSYFPGADRCCVTVAGCTSSQDEEEDLFTRDTSGSTLGMGRYYVYTAIRSNTSMMCQVAMYLRAHTCYNLHCVAVQKHLVVVRYYECCNMHCVAVQKHVVVVRTVLRML